MDDPAVPRHDDVRFEPTDVQAGPVVMFLGALLVVLAVLMLLLWGFQAFEIRQAEAAGGPVHPLAAARAELPERDRRPPEPRIEGIGAPAREASHSVTDPDVPNSAWRMRQDAETKLADGWTDATGRRHPPIDAAMRRVAEKVGKPGVKPVQPEWLNWPSAASSGREPLGGGEK